MADVRIDMDDDTVTSESPAEVDRRLDRVENRVGELARSLERLVPIVAGLREILAEQLLEVHQDVRRTGAVVDGFSATLDAEAAGRHADPVGGVLPVGVEAVLEELSDLVATGNHRMAARAEEDRQRLLEALSGLLGSQRTDLARLERQVSRLADATAERADADDVDAAVAELRDTVQRSLAAQATRIEARLETVRKELEPTAEGPLGASVDALRDEVVALREVVDEQQATMARLVESTAARAEGDVDGAIQQAAEAATSAITDATTKAVGEFRTAADRAVVAADKQLAATAARIDGLASTLAGLERAFLGYLEDHDRRAAIDRADLARQFVEQLADGLTRRERRRLAQRLELPEPPPPDDVAERLREAVARSSGASLPLPGEATNSTPSPKTSDGGEPEVRETTTVAATPTPDRDVAAAEPDAEPAAGQPAVVPPSRRKRPVRIRATDSTDPTDPAAVRRALAGVPGLGPRKQSALIDRFQTLDAIRAASDDELLAVPGVGPALLATLRQRLG